MRIKSSSRFANFWYEIKQIGVIFTRGGSKTQLQLGKVSWRVKGCAGAEMFLLRPLAQIQ